MNIHRHTRAAMSVVLSLACLAPVGANAQEAAPPASTEKFPVLLVPGWRDRASELAPIQARLLEEGWPSEMVTGVTFSDPIGSNEANAFQIARAVDALLARTGADRVDIVAHSMGGLAVREYMRSQGAGVGIRRAVFLGTPHRGTLTAALAWGDGGREMVPGSEFLDRLNGEPTGAPVEILAVRTPVDLNVIPSSSAMLPGARNLEICCPSHHGLLSDEQTLDEVLAFLLEGTERLSAPDESIPLRTDLAGRVQGRAVP